MLQRLPVDRDHRGKGRFRRAVRCLLSYLEVVAEDRLRFCFQKSETTVF
jgi:hypothetical protein